MTGDMAAIDAVMRVREAWAVRGSNARPPACKASRPRRLIRALALLRPACRLAWDMGLTAQCARKQANDQANGAPDWEPGVIDWWEWLADELRARLHRVNTREQGEHGEELFDGGRRGL